VAAIAVDPADSSHLLVGSAGGGVWESADGGSTWTPRTDDQPSLGIGAVAFDPSAPSRVYAGTGEGNTLEVPGQGLLRSDDGGTTWFLTAQSDFGGAFFYRLVVHPADGTRVFAATDGGTYRSTDGGESWSRRRTGLTWDLSLGLARGSAPGAEEVLAACQDGLYRSVDAGTTWAKVSLPGSPPTFAGAVGRMAVAHGPSDPGVAYAFAARKGSAWLWRRGAVDEKFAQVPLPSFDPPGTGQPGYGLSQSWYDWFVGVAPDDPDTVYLGAVEAFRGQRSQAGKWTWTDISSHSRGDSVHPDQHTVAFDPSQPAAVYVGNDGGIFRSPDRGDTWVSLNPGLGITEFEYLAQHPTARTWIIGGTQDNGTLRNRGGGVWDQVALGDGGDCAVERSSPKTCYHSYYGMAMDRSRSGGDTWDDVTPPVPDDYNALFYPPLEAAGTTVARAGESVLISDDEGDSWMEVSLPAGEVATAMTFASDDLLLVGRGDGGIVAVERTDGSWGEAQKLASPRRAYVSDLLAPAGTPDRYWATCSTLGGGHVFLSSDAGATWKDVTANLPDVPANAIEADPRDPDTVWVATDAGVFRSTTRGRSWSLYGEGLPRALAVDLAFHAQLRLLRVGTRSRGVWEIEVE
jgi:photosystem II stability/assembly factor-like uncharacterized protein